MSRAGENSRVRALTCTACVSRARPTRTCDDTVVPVRRNGVGGNARESNTPRENFVGTVCRRPLGRTVGYYKGQWCSQGRFRDSVHRACENAHGRVGTRAYASELARHGCRERARHARATIPSFPCAGTASEVTPAKATRRPRTLSIPCVGDRLAARLGTIRGIGVR